MWKGSRTTKTASPKRATSARRSGTTRARSNLAGSKVAHKRTKMVALRGSLMLLLTIVIFGGLSWISFHDSVAVQRIVVEGNSSVSARAVQATMMSETASPALFLFSKQNTLSYPSVELEALLLFKFPKIKTISIQRQPTQHQVLVSIAEREPYSVWCSKSEEERECYYLDTNGFIFEQTGNTSLSEMVIFRGGVDEAHENILRSNVAPEYFARVRSFLSELELIDLNPREVVFEGDDARVSVFPGWELRIALDKDLSAAAFNLEAVLSEHNLRERLESIKYIDMRFNERVYYTVHTTTDSEE